MEIESLISDKDRKILRDLATRQIEYANSERNKLNKEEWYRHRRFEPGKPMIHIEIDTFEHELIPPRIKCESELARQIETEIYRQILNYELFEDDRVVPDYFPVTWKTWFHLFNIIVNTTHAKSDDGSELGHHFNHVITNLANDMGSLSETSFGVDKEGTLEYLKHVEEVIGDILPVRLVGKGLYSVPTQLVVHLMSMENLFMAMYDTPDLLKKLMDRVANDYIRYFRFLEKEGLLFETTSEEHLGQGTFCYNEVLPKGQEKYVSRDLWGFMDSQETVGVSPEMFGEFIYPCYLKIAKEFGMLSYGCCEPVHSIWSDYISKLPNISNVSISPWCDEEYMGDQLRGKKIVYHRKPSPNYLGVPVTLDEDGVREHIRKTAEAAKGCQLEFGQRDVYTIHHNPEKVKRYVQIIRAVCKEVYKL